jgi:hypothetical protein
MCTAAPSVRELLANHSIAVATHAPYLSYLIPCNFFLFSRLTITLKGRRTSRLPRDTTEHSREAEGQSKTSLPHIN